MHVLERQISGVACVSSGLRPAPSSFQQDSQGKSAGSTQQRGHVQLSSAQRTERFPLKEDYGLSQSRESQKGSLRGQTAPSRGAGTQSPHPLPSPVSIHPIFFCPLLPHVSSPFLFSRLSFSLVPSRHLYFLTMRCPGAGTYDSPCSPLGSSSDLYVRLSMLLALILRFQCTSEEAEGPSCSPSHCLPR